VKSFLSALSLIVFLVTTLRGQQETKLTAFDGNPDDEFGAAVAVYADHALVAAPQNSTFPHLWRGTVYAYKRDSVSGEWELVNYIDGDGELDRFGTAVAMYRGYGIVGSPYSTVLGESNRGCAYILHGNDAGSYAIVSWLIAADGGPYDQFGRSVSICDSFALVGAPFSDSGGVGAGSAYVFQKVGSDWNQQATLSADDRSYGSYFGRSVAISGDFAVVGVNPDVDSPKPNAAYVFRRDGEDWIQETKLLADGFLKSDLFGYSVGIRGEYMMIGAPGDDDQGDGSGSVYAYKRAVGGWSFITKLLANDGSAGCGFGSAICMDEMQAIIGAERGSGTFDGTGVAYIFVRNGDTWTQQAKVYASDGAPADSFGISVAIHGNNAIVGALRADRSEWNARTGAAYIYTAFTSGYLSVTPQSIDFRDVPSGQSSTRPVEVENKGFADLHVTSVALTGPGSTQFEVDTASFTLSSRATKTLDVTFTPASLGHFSANLRIESDGGTGRISLYGNGSSALSVLPDTLDFGRVRVGYGNPTGDIVIANLGSTSMTVDTVYIHPISPPLSDFHIGTATPFVLSAGNSQPIEVGFVPQGDESYTASLRVVSDVAEDSVVLIGTGYQTGIPYVMPDTLNFGSVLLGQLEMRTFYVRNIGLHPLHVGPMTFTGQGSSYFNASPWDFTLQPGDSQWAVANYRAQTEGDFEVLLHTNTDAGDSIVVLIATGVPAGFIDVTPDTLHFGDTPLGTGTGTTLFVRNGGIVDLHVGPITVTGPNTSAFSVNTSPFTLSPGAVHRLTAGFTASTVGTLTASLNINSDGGNIVVPMDGNGISCIPAPKTVVTPSDAPTISSFGRSVSISGFNAIIGAGPDPMTSEVAAYIFRCDGSGWSQQAKLVPAYVGPYGNFGFSVDISGYHAIVGDPYHNDTGAVYVFNYQGGLFGGWKLVDTLKAQISSSTWRDAFGHSVAIDGDFAIVGAPTTWVDYNQGVGVAYIFRSVASPGTGGWHMLDSLMASDAVTNQRFGYSVDISDDFAIVGTLYSGAYIFQSANMIAGTRWYQREKLISSDYQPNDYFGSPVAINGDYALVGAQMKPAISQHGAVYAFKRIGTRWVEIAKITSPFPSGYEQFGNSIALSGDLALIGTLSQETVYLFQRLSDTNWVHVKTLYDDGVDPTDGFGDCVAVDARSGIGIIGISGDFVSGFHSGSAVVYSGFPTTAIEDHTPSPPAAFQLSQNYPNPFNPTTEIRYHIPRTSHVTLKVYDMLGREVATLVDERKGPGQYLVTFDGAGFASGVYFYRIVAGEFKTVKKFLLIK
jgi:hypothetical protein